MVTQVPVAAGNGSPEDALLFGASSCRHRTTVPWLDPTATGLMPPVPPAAGSRVAWRGEGTGPRIAMAPQVNFSVSSPVPPPPTVGMTAGGLLRQLGAHGALLECADGVEGSRMCLVHCECQRKDGSDEDRNLGASHMPALPRDETHKSYQGRAR